VNKENLLTEFGEKRRVLDWGHVRLVDVMGDDARVEEVARLSYEGARKVSETRGLLRYLMRHRHTSPFEQAVITLDIKLPIFVARQLVRHRAQSLNEVSARYSVLPDEFYVPNATQVCYQDANNKQGRSGIVSDDVLDRFLGNTLDDAKEAFSTYKIALEDGVARETARIGLPLSTYTHWYTTWDAHNLLHMLELRLDKHAQWEIRKYAEAIANIVKVWLPLTWEAFEDYRLNAETLARYEVEAVRAVFAGTLSTKAEDVTEFLTLRGASKREIRTFLETFLEEP
jgi:thymidylate synthase (FAD)